MDTDEDEDDQTGDPDRNGIDNNDDPDSTKDTSASEPTDSEDYDSDPEKEWIPPSSKKKRKKAKKLEENDEEEDKFDPSSSMPNLLAPEVKVEQPDSDHPNLEVTNTSSSEPTQPGDKRHLKRKAVLKKFENRFGPVKPGHVKCEGCGGVFKEGRAMTIHQMKCGEPYVCKLCGLSIDLPRNDPSAMHRMRRNHANECSGRGKTPKSGRRAKSEKCENCGKGFASVGSLRRHKEMNEVCGRVNRCPYCEQVFQSVAAMQGHVDQMHLN